ncbi:hypothetical protein [Parvibaculum sp.]|uniref:hypothetical protein n=1 Tax=Parvibaculum sp. TaxID=2024848 RepID=UPI0039196868
MTSLWRKLLQLILRRPRPADGRIAVKGKVITLFENGKSVSRIALDDIRKIDAYKIDEWTTDLICFDIHTEQNGERAVHTLHEDLPGFNDLMESLKQLPGFDATWPEKVIQPPFDENRTVIFER